MYKKRKTVKENFCDEFKLSIIDDFILDNPGVLFMIKQSYVEKSDGSFERKKDGFELFCSIPLEELIVPSNLRLNADGTVTSWCDDKVFLSIKHHDVRFYDGEIKGKTYKGLYMDFKNEENILKIKK